MSSFCNLILFRLIQRSPGESEPVCSLSEKKRQTEDRMKGEQEKKRGEKKWARFSLWQSNLLYSELLMVGGSPDHISRIWSSCSFAFTPNVDQEKEEHLVINHHSLASTITHPSPWHSPNSLDIVCTTCLLPNCISRKIPVITGSQPRMHTRHNDAGAGSGEILGNCVVVMIGN